MSTSDRPAVGIDLGTTFSVVAYLDRSGMPQTIMNMEGDLTTPSVVYFEEAEAVVGKEAVKAATYEPQLIAQFAKRDMGRQFYQRAIHGAQLPPEVIQACVLKKLKHDAEVKLGKLTDVVITVPAFFNEPRRKATMDAGRMAGLNVLDIINEPTAAAIAFGVQSGFVSSTGATAQKETVLVYDLGGGTFDVTLMELDGNRFTALATDGDVQLGGVDWDRRILDHLAEAFIREHGVDPREDPGALQALMREAEDAKRALSSRHSITIRHSYQGRRIQTTLGRDEFESLTSDLLQRTMFTVEKLLRDAKCTWSQLTRVLLVGGSTRMPMIQHALEQASGMSVDRSLSPDEAVAHGAALYAGFLQHGMHAQDRNLAVKNVNSHDLGVLAVEKATGMRRRRVMIPRNTPLPARSRSRFATQKKGQKRIVVNVVEGGDDGGKNSTAIGKCIVTGLPPGLPAGTAVVVQFHYAKNGRLSVKASLPDSRTEASMTIERASGMAEEELKQWTERIASGRCFQGMQESLASDAAVGAQDTEFQLPEAYDDDEDSEIFSDLDY